MKIHSTEDKVYFNLNKKIQNKNATDHCKLNKKS